MLLGFGRGPDLVSYLFTCLQTFEEDGELCRCCLLYIYIYFNMYIPIHARK